MTLSRFRHLLAASVVAAAAALGPSALAWPPRPPANHELIVGRADIIDGDTFRIGRQKIRVWGIDAPDDERKPYGTRALRQVLGAQTLTCRPVGASHDRIVARCTDPAGRDIARPWLRPAGRPIGPSFPMASMVRAKRRPAPAEPASSEPTGLSGADRPPVTSACGR